MATGTGSLRFGASQGDAGEGQKIRQDNRAGEGADIGHLRRIFRVSATTEKNSDSAGGSILLPGLGFTFRFCSALLPTP